MTRTLVVVVCAAGIAFGAAMGLQPGYAAEAAEADSDVPGWIVRSRWWRRPPGAPAPPTLSDISHDSFTVSWTAPESAAFPIIDFDVQYRVAETADFLDWAHDGTRTETTVTGLAEVTRYEVRVRAANEMGIGDWSAPVAGTTLLAPPMFVEGDSAERQVPENARPGTVIGDPVRATIRSGTLRYSLAGRDASTFAINDMTGQLATGARAAYDYETRSSYEFEVAATASTGAGTGRIQVRVAVADVDEPPGQPHAPEVESSGQRELLVTWSAPENTGPEITDYDVRYRAYGGSVYLDAGYVGAGTRATITGLAPGTLYEVQVRATNDEGTSAWSSSTWRYTESGGSTTGGGTSGGGSTTGGGTTGGTTTGGSTSGGGSTTGGGGTPPPSSGYAPATQAAFAARFADNYLSTWRLYIRFAAGGRFLEYGTQAGDYTYALTGENRGTVTQTYDDVMDDGYRCTIEMVFASNTNGTLRQTCSGGGVGGGPDGAVQAEQDGTWEDWNLDIIDSNSFNIEVVWSGTPSGAARSALRGAVQRWEGIISGQSRRCVFFRLARLRRRRRSQDLRKRENHRWRRRYCGAGIREARAQFFEASGGVGDHHRRGRRAGFHC